MQKNYMPIITIIRRRQRLGKKKNRAKKRVFQFFFAFLFLLLVQYFSP